MRVARGRHVHVGTERGIHVCVSIAVHRPRVERNPHAIDLHGFTVQPANVNSPLRGASVAALQFSIMYTGTRIFAH